MPAEMTASVLCAPLLDGAPQILDAVHRSSGAVQLADRSGRVRACVAARTAIRLPHSLTVPELPRVVTVVELGDGRLRLDGGTYRVSRWWRPARPQLPQLRELITAGAVDSLLSGWRDLLGRGEGLTPYGDDVLCGALVALHAAGSAPGRRLAAEIGELPLEAVTTAVSAALLRFAADGWCIDALANYLHTLSTGVREVEARQILLSVGHSSGRALLEGVHMVYGAAGARAA